MPRQKSKPVDYSRFRYPTNLEFRKLVDDIDLSDREIGEEMGVSPATVRAWLQPNDSVNGGTPMPFRQLKLARLIFRN